MPLYNVTLTAPPTRARSITTRRFGAASRQSTSACGIGGARRKSESRTSRSKGMKPQGLALSASSLEERARAQCRWLALGPRVRRNPFLRTCASLGALREGAPEGNGAPTKVLFRRRRLPRRQVFDPGQHHGGVRLARAPRRDCALVRSCLVSRTHRAEIRAIRCRPIASYSRRPACRLLPFQRRVRPRAERPRLELVRSPRPASRLARGHKPGRRRYR